MFLLCFIDIMQQGNKGEHVNQCLKWYSKKYTKDTTHINVVNFELFIKVGALTASRGICNWHVQGDGALEAGVRLLPLIMFMVAVSMLNGFLMPKYGLIPVWYIGGSALALIGSALMCKLLIILVVCSNALQIPLMKPHLTARYMATTYLSEPERDAISSLG